MSDSARPAPGEPFHRMPDPAELHPRGAGASQAESAKEALPPQGIERSLRPVPAPPERPLVKPPLRISNPAQPSGMQRAMDLIRGVLPVVQKVLPLLDGNVASVVANVLAPRPQTPRPVNLAPIEDVLGKMHMEQRELRSQIAEQNTSILRVADQLEKVKEATDRNTLEQQELMDDLHRMRKKMVVYAWVGMGLLAIAIAANVVLFLRIQRILP